MKTGRELRPNFVIWKGIARKIYSACCHSKRSLRIVAILLLLAVSYVFFRRVTVFNEIKEEDLKRIRETEQRRRLMFVDSGDTVILPSKEKMANMSYAELSTLYHRYVNSLQFKCDKILRLGQIQDGGWDICDDHEFRPRNNCLVYSFGIDYDFSFDDDIVRRYGCEVHSFDPSMKEANFKGNPRVSFHQIGLSDESQILRGKGWKMNTLTDIRTELGHTKAILDILKLDIEEWEWFVLPQIISSGIIPDYVRQLNVELHLSIRILPNQQRYLSCLYTLKDLYDLGYRIIWTHRNLWCKFYWNDVDRTGCHELSMVRLS